MKAAKAAEGDGAGMSAVCVRRSRVARRRKQAKREGGRGGPLGGGGAPGGGKRYRRRGYATSPPARKEPATEDGSAARWELATERITSLRYRSGVGSRGRDSG